jgi:hypothetical protein
VKIKFDESDNESKLEFNLSAIKTTIQSNVIRDRKIVIVSVFGVAKEKFYLSNGLSHYLESGGKDITGNDDPLDANFMSISGRDKSGITMWSKPFCATTDTDEQLAIILMEINSDSNFEKNLELKSKLLTFSLLISSITIYESWSQINVAELSIIQILANSAAKISDKNSMPLQNVILIVRDWMNPEKYAYGWRGGEKYLNNILEKEKNFPHSLYTNLSKMRTFLMPAEGMRIEKSKTIKMNTEFKNEFMDFGETIIDEFYFEEIADQLETGSEMFANIKKYSDLINDMDMELEYPNNGIEMNVTTDEKDSFSNQIYIEFENIIQKLIDNVKIEFCNKSGIEDQELCNNKFKSCKMQILDLISDKALCIKDMKNCFNTIPQTNEDKNYRSTDTDRCFIQFLEENRVEEMGPLYINDEAMKRGQSSKSDKQSDLEKQIKSCEFDLNKTTKELDETEEQLNDRKETVNKLKTERDECKKTLSNMEKELNKNLKNNNERKSKNESFYTDKKINGKTILNDSVIAKINSNLENDVYNITSLDHNFENNDRCIEACTNIEYEMQQFEYGIQQFYFWINGFLTLI